MQKFHGPVFFAKRVITGLRRRIIGDRHTLVFLRVKGAFTPGGTILFLPQGAPVIQNYIALKVCYYLGLQPISSGTPSTRVAIFWQDRTHTDQPPETPYQMLNRRCTDISKQRMQRAMEEVFGYNLSIDPLVHIGSAVCKSDENSLHDGRVIQRPIQTTDPACVYQILIDNTITEEAVEDIRVVVVGSKMPMVYLKRRWKYQRFLNTNFEVVIRNPESVLSQAEIGKILQFANAIGLDFGEMDVLRDRSSGKIYIVDTSKTAFGPPARLGFFPKIRAVRVISETFRSEFLSPNCLNDYTPQSNSTAP